MAEIIVKQICIIVADGKKYKGVSVLMLIIKLSTCFNFIAKIPPANLKNHSTENGFILIFSPDSKYGHNIDHV